MDRADGLKLLFQTPGEPRPKRAKPAANRRANALDGKTWTKYSISVWSDIRKTPEEIALHHPAIFPVELPKRLIEIFSKQNDRVVLDPFAGIGSTIVAARSLGKKGIGIEISQKYSDLAREWLSQEGLFLKDSQSVIHNRDARELLQIVEPGSVDLVITSPPYWDVLSQKRTADYKPTRDYESGSSDLGKIASYHGFLNALKRILTDVHTALRVGAYCCVVVMDLRKKERFYPFHSDVANLMQEIGFIYDDVIIWDRRHEYNNMRPLGYPFVFRVNKAHEYILLFLKAK